MFDQGLVDLREARENLGVGREFLALLDEGANDVDAHFDGARAAQDVGEHDGPVLGEGPGTISWSPVFPL